MYPERQGARLRECELALRFRGAEVKTDGGGEAGRELGRDFPLLEERQRPADRPGHAEQLSSCPGEEAAFRVRE